MANFPMLFCPIGMLTHLHLNEMCTFFLELRSLGVEESRFPKRVMSVRTKTPLFLRLPDEKKLTRPVGVITPCCAATPLSQGALDSHWGIAPWRLNQSWESWPPAQLGGCVGSLGWVTFPLRLNSSLWSGWGCYPSSLLGPFCSDMPWFYETSWGDLLEKILPAHGEQGADTCWFYLSA